MCTPPKCTLTGQVKQLVNTCYSYGLGPVRYYDDSGAEITSVTCPDRVGDAVIVEPRASGPSGAACPVHGPKFSVVAPPCPDSAIVNLTCKPVTCYVAGTVIPLEGTCTSSIAGADYTFKVDGVNATSVTCPFPGVGVRVEPSISACYGIPACDYRERAGPPTGTDCACVPL